ncbi:ABC transporter permease [Trueperella bialowiezensis]|uniref:Sulfate transport system permease protein CysW n=1 Tax=Trueperella bialowiezensis TaxID=312285 RepID=A0A3S4VTP6_9ACTO|nr:iron ABC transporter permease [Trueperella bialowiezensis]VEI13498.1 Sulfate transport system permease protein CysW [Trueperella bialowiezensis]
MERSQTGVDGEVQARKGEPKAEPVRYRPFSKYNVKLALKHPATLMGIVLVAFFGYMILAPVISLLLSSIQTNTGDSFRTGTEPGEFTTYYLERALTSDISVLTFWQPLLNTLVLAGLTIIFALLIGVPTAFLLARTDLPGRKWFSTALIVPYMIPAWTFALAWRTIFKNRKVAGSQGWLEAMGFSPPDWLAYGPVPIVIIFTLHLTPFIILLVTGAISNIPEDMDEAARIHGAPFSVRFRRVFLPLLRPSILSAATLIVAKVIGEFGVTYVLGTPVKFQVLATTLYQSIDTSQGGVAGVIALTMVLIGAISLSVDFIFVRNMSKYTVVGGKGSAKKEQKLGRFRPVAFTWVTLMFFVSVFIPLFVLVLSTLLRTPGVLSADNVTLDYWIGRDLPFAAFKDGILLNERLLEAMKNTLLFVGIASIGSGVLGMAVGYVVVRSPWKWLGTILRSITFTPYLVPGIAFAAAYISLFAVQRGPIPALYGTPWILIFAMMMDEMPFASRAGVSAMMQLGKEPEEAAQSLGAGWLARMRRIVIPLQRTALASAILLPFVSGIQSLSLVIVLATPGTEMMTTLNMFLIDSGYDQAANAVTVVICVLALGLTWLSRKVLKADLSQGMGA